ncbi:MAG TPA: hypothetical protein PLC42_03170 [Parachlamydiaceae bacterium]|nr:hypothetical protein [Parachlamydiaceae bacterium]
MKIFDQFICFFTFYSFLFPLHSDIQEVKVFWSAPLCTPSCYSLLATEFRKVPGVADVEMNGAAGQANLKWTPNASFSFHAVDAAMRMVGPRLHNIRVKVRGKIQEAQGTIKLISEGDQTEFYLLGPAGFAPGQTLTQSVYNRPLTPNIQEKLLSAKQQNLTVIIDGPLFQPQRSPPNQLVAENISFEP